MSKGLVTTLKKLGLYEPLVSLKRKFDKIQYEKKDKAFHSKRIEFYKKILKPGDLVFDVGANVGNRVKVFLDLGCKVIAVEPQQECIIELRKKFGNSITIIDKGLGESVGEKTLYLTDVSTIASVSEEWIDNVKQNRFSQHNWDRQIKIDLTTLDALIGEFGIPKFCKIDVEGYELQVLKGLSKPVPCLSLEYTVPELTNRLLECIQYMNEINKNYKYNYSKGEEMLFELPEFISYTEMVNLIQQDHFQRTGFGDIYLKI